MFVILKGIENEVHILSSSDNPIEAQLKTLTKIVMEQSKTIADMNTRLTQA